MINVDCSQTTHIGLCAGYGGIELGLRRAIPTLRSVALCEIEAFAVANLVAKMEAGLLDSAPIWTDLKTFPWEGFRDRVDILTGGYPCQPFSAAGKRAGEGDPRHLWPFIASGIRLLRPRICFFENVEGHISLGLSNVIEDLAGMGYRTTWGIFSASEVGAPHQRKRVFIMAYIDDEGLQKGISTRINDQVRWEESSNGYTESSNGHGCVMADSDCGRSGENQQPTQLWTSRIEQSLGDSRGGDERQIRETQEWPSRPGEPQHEWEPPRVVAHSDTGTGSPKHELQESSQGGEAAERAATQSTGSSAAVMANSDSPRLQERQGQRGEGIQGTYADGGEDTERQAKPSMGRDADGPANWMDHAELFTTCDNRTDELRLLGNGVVPATAERAFRVLMEQFA